MLKESDTPLSVKEITEKAISIWNRRPPKSLYDDYEFVYRLLSTDTYYGITEVKEETRRLEEKEIKPDED